MKRLIACLLLSLGLMSCGAHYTVHAGSINTFDSVTADTLSGIKATIDSTRPKFQAGTLPANLKPLFTKMVEAYNTADISYKAWRTAMKANPGTTKIDQLQANMAAVTAALAAYAQAGGK